jgi:hypothetical protein
VRHLAIWQNDVATLPNEPGQSKEHNLATVLQLKSFGNVAK